MEITISAPKAPASIIDCNVLYPVDLNLFEPYLSKVKAILSATEFASRFGFSISPISI